MDVKLYRTYEWQFDVDGNNVSYMNFHPKLGAFIELHYKNKLDDISFSMDHGHLDIYQTTPTHKIDFNKMTQIRLIEPFTVRKIKRVDYPSSSIPPCQASIYWEWDATGIIPGSSPSPFLSYDIIASAILEKAFLENPNADGIQIDSQGLPLIVNLGRMEQKNPATGRTRFIRRVVDNSFTPMGQLGLGDYIQAQANLASSHSSSQNKDYFKNMSQWKEIQKDSLHFDDICCICQSKFNDSNDPMNQSDAVVLLSKCHGHYFHETCACGMLQNKPKCGFCGVFYSVPIGNCPNGTMVIQIDPTKSAAGYENYSLIIIIYEIPDGIQSATHQNPGVAFTGTTRMAFLPNSPEGREALSLLCHAFERRLTFTVGQSLTTGFNNSVVWTTIHHKTTLENSPFGYPDAGYLNRVKNELNEVGIID